MSDYYEDRESNIVCIASFKLICFVYVYKKYIVCILFCILCFVC